MILIFRVAEVTFPYIFDVKMLIVANIFKDFHHHHHDQLTTMFLKLLLSDYRVLGQIKTHVALKGEPSLSTKDILS